MEEARLYKIQMAKLDQLCRENDLKYELRKNGYPIRLVIMPNVDVSKQISLLESKNKAISPDAVLELELEAGEITYRTSQEFVISDSVFAKIKSIFKQMVNYWLQYFFAVSVTEGLICRMPEIDDDEEILRSAQQIEEFVDDDFIDQATAALEAIDEEDADL